MASTTVYDPHVFSELAMALEKARKYSPCEDHIGNAAFGVKNGDPIAVVVEDIINAMAKSSNNTVLYSLSQAIAWIGPMGEATP